MLKKHHQGLYQNDEINYFFMQYWAMIGSNYRIQINKHEGQDK